MSRSYVITMQPNGQGWKPEIVAADSIAALDNNTMILAYGDTVNQGRQMEILNGWKWLWHGVRDRKLLDVQFLAQPVVSGADIDSLTESNRRTESLPVSFLPNDVLIGIGGSVSNPALPGAVTGASQMMDSGFRMLREYARENPL